MQLENDPFQLNWELFNFVGALVLKFKLQDVQLMTTDSSSTLVSAQMLLVYVVECEKVFQEYFFIKQLPCCKTCKVARQTGWGMSCKDTV